MYQAAVWGQMMSGGGHTTLTKVLAFTGVPVMTRLSLIAEEKKKLSDGQCYLRIP